MLMYCFMFSHKKKYQCYNPTSKKDQHSFTKQKEEKYIFDKQYKWKLNKNGYLL